MTISRDVNMIRQENLLSPVDAIAFHFNNSMHEFDNSSFNLTPEEREERAASIRQTYADATLKLLEENTAKMSALEGDTRPPVDLLSHDDMLNAGAQLPALREATAVLTTEQVLARARAAANKAEAFSWIAIVTQRVPQDAAPTPNAPTAHRPSTAVDAEAKEVLALLEDKLRGPRKPVDSAHVSAVRQERVAAMRLLSKLSAAQNLNDRRARYTASF